MTQPPAFTPVENRPSSKKHYQPVNRPSSSGVSLNPITPATPTHPQPPSTVLQTFLPFVDWLHCHKPIFGALLETHVKEPSLRPLITKLCPDWNYFTNHSSDPDGRIILIWRDPIQINIIRQSSQCVTCIISLPNQPLIHFTAIYAFNTNEERVELWTDLLQLHSDLDLDSHCWIIGGDLNQIMCPFEHSSLSMVVLDSLMYQLQECFLKAGLFDLRFLGTLSYLDK
ncbi:hypothetical protein DY000_02008290 [Brassica cretica]|uniref:Endonuclease/exonuclease/phosphatase domain-containing protein n=1 Tax=Brassica cretica TaxID=69181 RepID=A0ABQ7C1J4_BRACR|nr:hypothetical protein DY000_02008290 [Brassica cretica]